MKRIAESKISDIDRADYILLCLKDECCGTDIMKKIAKITDGRICVGPGTLYNLLEQFVYEEIICETTVEGRKRSYILTDKGKEIIKNEYNHIQSQADDYMKFFGKEF